MKTKMILAALLAGGALAACGEKPGGADDQQNKPANIAQDSAGAAVGMGTAAIGSISADAFVEAAAMGDMYEIEAARMALERSKSVEIKRLAQMILTDHSASSAKLKALVDSGQISQTLPTALDERRKGLLDNLRGAGGTDFDGRWIKQQVSAHHEAFALMNGYKTVGQDQVLKVFAAEAEPKIQAHLDMAQSMAGEAISHTGEATAPPAAPAS